jgi:hypothetical protein
VCLCVHSEKKICTRARTYTHTHLYICSCIHNQEGVNYTYTQSHTDRDTPYSHARTHSHTHAHLAKDSEVQARESGLQTCSLSPSSPRLLRLERIGTDWRRGRCAALSVRWFNGCCIGFNRFCSSGACGCRIRNIDSIF